MVDIDNTLVESTEKGFVLENRANNFKVRFSGNSWDKPREMSGEMARETVRETSGTASREMLREKPGEQKLGQIQQKEHALAWRLMDSKESPARAVLNTIIYPDITDYTDLRYIIDGKTLKEEIILNDPEAPSEFKFALDIRHLDYTMRDDGSIDFTDPGTGDVIWNMPKPYMYDAAGKRSQAVTAEIGREYGLFGETVLTVKADPEWLAARNRAFPVVIDPTLQPGERFGRDTFISSKYPDTAYNDSEYLYVGDTAGFGDTMSFFYFRDIIREANATVTEATFSVYAAGGSPDSVDLYRVIPDVMWDYEVLTWNWWQTVSARGDTLGELVDSTAGPSSGWWNFDVLDLVQRWMEDPVKKNGGLALVPGSGSGYVKLISSNYGADDEPRSDTYNSKHPKLTYTYTLNPPQQPADFSLGIDRDTGEIRAYGSARDDARIYLSTGDGDNYTTSADSSGEWEIDGLTFEEGKYKTISMYYTYEIEWTDEEGETHTETITGDTTSQKFLVTRYSKGARMKRMAKFYYLDGTKDDLLREINEIDTELDMVVGDYVLIPDPKREKPYTGGEIITDPDEEYRLREKIRPLYANGDIVGSSVDAATGNFFVMDTDLSFDAMGLPVEFTRFFNAREPEIYRGPMGQNWYMGYDKMLVKYEDGSILATGGDGGGYFFRKSGSRYVSDDDVTEQLVKNGDGTYSVITKYDTVYHFNDDGMLDRVTDRNGNAVTMTYDGEGLLRQVTDAAGRTCTLYYDEMGRVIIIQDPEGRQVDYDYDNWGRLLQVIDPNGGAVKYEYGYVDEEGLAHDNYLVTKVTDPMGNVAVVNEYDSEGRVVRQTDAAGYTVSMDYDSGRTTYTDRNGNEFIYEFDSEYRVTSISGPDTADGTVYVNYAASAEDSKFTDTQTGGTVPGITEMSITDVSINEGTVTGEPDPVVTSASATRILAEYHYDGQGNRDTVTDAMGNMTQYDYDSRNNLTSVINADGKETTYVYDNDTYVTDIIDAMDNKTHLEYDGNGNLLKVTDAEGKTTTYTYYGSGQVKSVSDPAGKTVSYTYDSDGNAATVKDGRGYITHYRYDGISRLEEVEDPKGNSTYYEYDDNGNLLSERTPIGETVNSYNYNNYLTGTRDPEGNVTTFEYDARGLMVREKDPMGKYTRMGYDGNGSRIWTEDANGNRTEYRYDDLGRLRELTEPAGDTTTYSYDPNGNRTAVTDAKGETTHYEYDILNRLEAVNDPLGRQAAYTYDDLGNTLTYTDFDGTVTEYRYDSLSRVQQVIDHIGSATKFTYDPSGNRETVTNTLNQTYTYRYDGRNNLEKIIDPAGNITRFEYDEINNRTAMIDALGQRTTYEYDDMGRLVRVSDPLNRDTEIELDKNGNRLAVTDGSNNTTRFGYDANGRLEQVIDAKNNITRYKYDDVGNLVLFNDANNNATQYKYNEKNLLTEVINPLGQQTSYVYDQNGNITSKTDPNGNTVEYEYDELNRLLGAYYPDGSYVEYGYNDQGKREWMEDIYGTTWYDYDQMGRLTSVTNQDDITTEYDYNQLGQKTMVRYPDGKEVSYSYDNLNRLETVTDRLGKATTYKYDAIGRRTETVLPNGVVTSYDYDTANQLTGIASINPADKLLAKYEYTYDGDGNRITKLSAMTQPWHEEEIKQDNGKGNDPEFVPPGQQKSKKQRADLVYMLLKNDRGEGGKSKGNSGGSSGNNGGGNDNGSSGNNGGGNSGGINGNGNDKDKPDNGKDNGNDKDKANSGKDDVKVKNKDLDKEKREEKKEKTKEKNGYRKKGKYENRGKHLGWYKNGKIPSGAEEKVELTYYLNDVSDPLTQVLMTYNEEGNFDAAYTERIEVEALDDTRPESQDPLYYLYDGLGSVTFMVKPDGNKRDHYRYDEFGKPAPGNSKLSEDGRNVLHNTFGYTGEMWDQESELLYLRARYYEPETGRFLSRDSYEGNLQNPLSRHLYAYVGNNPVNYVDPSGRMWVNGVWIYDEIVNSRTEAGLRDLVENLGGKIQYNIKTRVATVDLNGITIELQTNKYRFRDGHVLINVRSFMNAFGISERFFTWDKIQGTASLQVFLPNYDDTHCSETLDRKEIKQLINDLNTAIKAAEDADMFYGSISEGATVLGTLGRIYSVTSYFTIEWDNRTTTNDLKKARDILDNYYHRPDIVAVQIVIPYWYSSETIIGYQKLFLKGGQSILDYLVHKIKDQSE